MVAGAAAGVALVLGGALAAGFEWEQGVDAFFVYYFCVILGGLGALMAKGGDA